MAHNILTPQVIARAVLGVLNRNTVLPMLVWRDAVAEFSGKIGDTVTVRLPAKMTARTRTIGATAAITTDDVVEFPVAVQLTEDVYSAVATPDATLTLNIVEFVQQVLRPQLRAVVDRLEDNLATTITGATYPTTTNTQEWDAADPFGSVVNAGRKLNALNVPRSGRVLVCGAQIEADLLQDERVSRVDGGGADAATAIQTATIARPIAGFQVVGSNAIDDGEAYAFHREAFVMANRAPMVPTAGAEGSSQVLDGLAIRSIRDYDSSTLQDRSVLNSYIGSAVVTDPVDPTDANSVRVLRRAVKIVDATS
jgi:hypothetical protein